MPASVLSDAQSLVDQYSGIPEFEAPGDSFDATPLKGKSILVVVFSQQAAQLVTLADGISAAADAAGLESSSINADGNITAASAAIQQGITQGVDAIILDGVPAQLVVKDIAAAGDKDIPVVASTIGTSYETPGLFGLSSADYVLTGKLMASGAIVKADGEAVTAGTLTFTNPAVPDALTGIQEVFDSCGSACSIVGTTNVEPPDWGTGLSSAASSLINGNPDINTIFAVVDDTMGLLASAGVDATSNTGVTVVAAQGSGAGPLGVVQQGGAFSIDPGQSAAYTGWGAVDQAMRAMLDLEPGEDITPPRYIDTAVLKGLDVADQDAIYGNAYVDGFTELWGLSK
ncbi:substrate-binding domain-containing protein [Naasia lichenicola]|uniref:substrate-binding domain-containing protein n=1 Tax=Naasia lichenicola TaxID=2565933 RepID=UPI00130D4DDB|nr:substrate-binding domain-containing protein [Naasia lichenicola]